MEEYGEEVNKERSNEQSSWKNNNKMGQEHTEDEIFIPKRIKRIAKRY